MKPNFEEMSTPELRAYVLEHREDIEPLRILMNRGRNSSKAMWFPPLSTPEGVPIEENIRLAEEALKERIEQGKQKKKDSQS